MNNYSLDLLNYLKSKYHSLKSDRDIVNYVYNKYFDYLDSFNFEELSDMYYKDIVDFYYLKQDLNSLYQHYLANVNTDFNYMFNIFKVLDNIRRLHSRFNRLRDKFLYDYEVYNELKEIL